MVNKANSKEITTIVISSDTERFTVAIEKLIKKLTKRKLMKKKRKLLC